MMKLKCFMISGINKGVKEQNMKINYLLSIITIILIILTGSLSNTYSQQLDVKQPLNDPSYAQEVLPYAILSLCVYDEDVKYVPINLLKKWILIDDVRSSVKYEVQDTDPDGNIFTKFLNDPFGFHASVYKNENDKIIAISFEGTDSSSISDWYTNLYHLVDIPTQYRLAVEYTETIIEQYADQYEIVLTGHSLGGGLASYASLKFGLKSYNFNPAGLWRPTIYDTIMNPPKNVANIVAKGLNMWFENFFLDLGLQDTDFVSQLGQLVGSTYEIDVDSSTYLNLHLMTNLYSTIKQLSMNPNLIRTNVGGLIRNNTTWSVKDSPFLVVQNVVVPENVNLIIEPGVRVEFNASADTQLELIVNGEITAIGTQENPIIFTSSKPDLESYDFNIVFTEELRGATFNSKNEYVSGSILKNVIIEHAFGKQDYYQSNCLRINKNSPYLCDLLVQFNYGTISYYDVSNNLSIIENTMFFKNQRGCIYSDSVSSLYINKCLFQSNKAFKGAIHSTSDIYVYHSEFVSNYAEAYGSSIYSIASSKIYDCAFLSNKTELDGGAIYFGANEAEKYKILSCIFHDNKILNNGWGGAISSSSRISSIFIDNSLFQYNVSTRSGGAIFSMSSANIKNSNFKNNSSLSTSDSYGGGALYLSATKESTISDCEFKNNLSNSIASAFYISSSKLLIKDTSVTNNKGKNAITLKASQGLVTRTNIFDNFSINDDIVECDGVFIDDFNDDFLINKIIFVNSNIYKHNRYNIKNESEFNVYAMNNYWGFSDELSINMSNYDKYDDSQFGEVIIYPFYDNLWIDLPLKGDINGDNHLDLYDIILSLKLLNSITVNNIDTDSFLSDSKKFEIKEILYLINSVSKKGK